VSAVKVSDVMTYAVTTVREDTPFKEIAEILIEMDVSGLPVVDEDGLVIGIVTESDLLNKEAYPRRETGRIGRLATRLAGDEPSVRKAAGVTAGDVMSAPVISVGSDDTVHDAARLMIERGVKRLPVMDGGRLVGIVTRHDLVRIFCRTDGELQTIVERFLEQCLYVAPDNDVHVRVKEGIATLSGSVHHASDVRVAGSLVETLDGVVSVSNLLVARERDPRFRRSEHIEQVG
jgi:CBS domain-containing protein